MRRLGRLAYDLVCGVGACAIAAAGLAELLAFELLATAGTALIFGLAAVAAIVLLFGSARGLGRLVTGR